MFWWGSTDRHPGALIVKHGAEYSIGQLRDRPTQGTNSLMELSPVSVDQTFIKAKADLEVLNDIWF